MPSSPLHTLGRYAWLAGLLLTAFSMPLWNLGMSLGQFVMAGGWLLAADLPGRLKKVIRQPFFWLVGGLFLLHLIGLWNTEDFGYGMKDIRVKLPLFLMALMFAGGPDLTAKEYRSAFYALLTGVFISTGFGFAMRAGFTGIAVHDYRDYSHFISHIRLSLLIDFCIAWMIISRKEDSPAGNKIFFAGTLLWLITYLLMIQSITGLAILAVLGISEVIRQAWIRRTSGAIRLAGIVTIVALSGSIGLYYYVFVDSIKYVNFHPLPKSAKTARGGTYECNFQRQDIEEGRLVWENYCEGEINLAWKERTGKEIWQTDAKEQMYQVTILRYLTSKQYTKDYAGVMLLSEEDIRKILNGEPSPNEKANRNNPLQRINDLATEYRIWYYSGWANGLSMAQRFEYIKAARWIFTRNLITGVGTGDLPAAYSEAYFALNSSLKPEWRLRAHNQYLTFGVAFGIPGIVFLIFVLAWLLVQSWKNEKLLLTALLIISAISFLNEDTLETQAGVTFFAFLCGLLWRYSDRPVSEGSISQ